MINKLTYYLFFSVLIYFNASILCANPSNYNANQVDSLASKVNSNIDFKQVELTTSIINSMESYYADKENILNNKDFNNIAHLISFYSRDNEKRTYYFNKLRSVEDLSPENKLLTNYWENFIRYYNQEYEAAVIGFTTIINDDDFDLLKDFKAKSFIFLASSQEELKNFMLADTYYKKALKENITDKGLYYNTIQDFSICHYKQKKITEAIDIINSADNFYSYNTSNPELDLWAVKLLQLRSFYYRELALNNIDSIRLLTLSLKDINQSIELSNHFVQKLHFESDQLRFNHNSNYIFYKGIEASLRLNQAQAQDSLLQKAFYYSELDKSLTLIRHFNKEKALEQHAIPTNDLQAMNAVYTQLEELEANIYNEQAQFHPNEKNLLDYYLQKEQLLNTVNDMEFALEQAYPSYKEQRQQLPALDTSFIFELSHQKQIIEFQVSDENIYCFLINNGKIYHHVAAYNDDFIANLKQYRLLLADANYIDYSDEQFHQFTELSHDLYNYLLEPITSHMDDKALLIIPDNELHLLPFETLLSKKYLANDVDYSSLPYLLKRFDISYANSLFLLQHQMGQTQELKESKLLSYAPSYKNLPGNEGNQYLALRDARDELGNLPGAQNEVRLIKQQVRSEAFFNEKASEESFKESAGLYPIIHCAMHTLIDNENPQFSKLVFTPDTDTKEDGLLHTYELNRMNIPCEMVVLSACNTAFGNVSKGEGLLNLSRGFTKAGCKSVLSTLWSVSDVSSASVMDNFYKELVQQQSKSSSLSKAKRTYLRSNSGTLAHPFYWSGYILSGNDDDVLIKARGNYTSYLLIISSIIALGLLFFILRSRKRNLSFVSIN